MVQDARAQFTAPASQSVLPQLGSQKVSAPPTSAEGMTFESSIDPDEYHLGPGDVFECSFWTSGETFYPVVSSDNMLVLPNLGAFDVRGKTLAQVRQSVLQTAAASFSSRKQDSNRPPVTLSLYQPRKIYVKVKGDVATPGDLALTSTTRADVAVDLANKIDPAMLPVRDPSSAKQMEIDETSKKRLQSIFGARGVSPASERYLTVAHEDGTTDRVDLVRYNSLHDPKASPPLRQGDVIMVPFRDMLGPTLGVYGAVQSSGDFEYVKGDSLCSAIAYAFGPSANADIHHVELIRIGSDGEAGSPIVFDLASIQNHQSADIALAPNDRIIVGALPEEHRGAVVDVRGEVTQPGIYPITEGRTKLSQVIRESGGISPRAYPAAGVVLRHGHEGQLTAGTPEEIAQSMRLEDLGVADTANFQKQASMRFPTVIVDMNRLLVHNDSSADITLEDGDEIVIPKRPTTVYVFGFVNNAGYVNYQEGAPLRYYIAQAGGYAAGAVKSETVVIKLHSKAWMDPSDTPIEPGDEIFVPKESDNPVGYETQNLAAIGGLITGIGGFIVAIYLAFLKK